MLASKKMSVDLLISQEEDIGRICLREPCRACLQAVYCKEGQLIEWKLREAVMLG